MKILLFSKCTVVSRYCILTFLETWTEKVPHHLSHRQVLFMKLPETVLGAHPPKTVGHVYPYNEED